MSHREITPADFEGKTIAYIDCGAVNILRFYFTDGSAIAIEHERDGMVACDACADGPRMLQYTCSPVDPATDVPDDEELAIFERDALAGETPGREQLHSE